MKWETETKGKHEINANTKNEKREIKNAENAQI